MSTTGNPYRLARTIIPSAYRIFLTPDLDAATFAGRVEIDVAIEEATSLVTLHAKDLDLGAATLTAAGTSHRSSPATYDATYETATYSFDTTLPVGPATLEIAFTGTLNDQLVGFYRSTFTDADGASAAATYK